MSLYVIPQKALDSLACDSCHKYLSVTPVKLFPNRTVKCGRCVLEDDGGIISMYNEVAKKSIFKCINHYEGCQALLHPSEVHKHEQTCESKKYECPNCNEKIPSYLIYKHFIIKHKELVLKKTYFVIDDSERCVHFLYCNKDYLMFVKYFSHLQPYSNCINVQFRFSVLNSKTAETLKVNVIINCGDIIKEKKMDCDFFPLDAGNDFKVELDLIRLVVFAFSLEESKSKVTVQKAVITTENVEIPKENYIHAIAKAINKRPSESLSSKLGEEMLGMYFIRKDKWAFFNFTEFLWLYNSSYEAVREIHIRDLVFTCFMCSLEYENPVSGYCYVAYKCKKYYLICFMCQQAQIWPQHFWVLHNYVRQTNYCCKWECGKPLYLSESQKHERHCDKQISQPCPVKLCNFNCKLFEIKDHFEEDHPNLELPVFHDSQIGEYLKLIPSGSPLKIIYVVSHIYIGIELIWDKSEWKISLTCTISNARPRMIIFKNHKFVTLINGNGSCPNFDNVNYKCYLADPKREQYE